MLTLEALFLASLFLAVWLSSRLSANTPALAGPLPSVVLVAKVR